MVQVFDYEDYRDFLNDFYQETKKLRPQFSYRSFALKAKINSPNYLKLVIDGKRRITTPQIPKFLRGLGLQGYEASYFINLVHLENASAPDMKQHYAEQMAHIKKISKVKSQILDEHIQEKLSHWETWALREFFQITNAPTDETSIQERFAFPVETKKIKDGLNLLKNLGLVTEQNRGQLKPAQSILIMGNKVKSEALKNLHKEYLELAKQSIDQIPKDRRRLAGLTLALKSSDFEKISKQLIQYISDLNKTYSENPEPDEIYHLELALFPITKNRRPAP